MSRTAELTRLWRHAFEENLRYYGAVARLTGEYGRAVAGTARDLVGSRASQSAAEPAAPNPAPAPIMALEAEAGSQAVGLFVVENRSPRRVSAAVELPALADPEGRAARVGLAFEPETLDLGPGEQTLVQVSVAVDEGLREEVDYRGELHVPALPGTRVPIVVRRLPKSRT
ncbi:MAG TPA: hypothetical protein VGF23_02480 [Gaiellaceae bacterium]